MHELLNAKSGKIISLPQDIDELTPTQYAWYLELALKFISGEISDPDEIKSRLFVYLTGAKISWRVQFYSRDTRDAIWADMRTKVNLLDSFFDIYTDEGKEVYSMHLKCTKNLLPHYRYLTGPSDLLFDTTWGTFKQCLNALKLLQTAGAEKNAVEADKYSRDIFFALYRHSSGSMPAYVHEYAIFHAINWFSYWYEIITTTPIQINGEEVDFSLLWKETPGGGKANDLDKSGWLGITYNIAESGVFGTSEEVDQQKTYKVLMYLYKLKAAEIFEIQNTPQTP